MSECTIATGRTATTTPSSSRRVAVSVAASALLVLAAFVTLFTAVKIGHGVPTTALIAPDLVQDSLSDRPPQFVNLPGEPY